MAKGKSGFGFDDSNFLKKLRSMESMGDFFRNIHKDAAAFLQEKLVQEVIAGQYVGVISGNLRRSQEVIPVSEIKTLLATDLTVAPYAPFVLAWSGSSAGRGGGRNFLQIVLDLYMDEVNTTMKRGYNRMMRIVESRQIYKYKNPF